MRILHLDDDRLQLDLVRQWLEPAGHVVVGCASGREALKAIDRETFDMAVLDWMVPDVSGEEVLRSLRARHRAMPVIFATANDGEAEVAHILSIGADDYLVKPFAAEQLDARIRAVLRRSRGEDALEPIAVGGLRIDAKGREEALDGRRLDLTKKEFELLLALAERAGRVVTRRELLASVWEQPYGGPEKTIDVHVAWLRRKLGEGGGRDGYIRTVRGVGLKLVDPRG